MKFGDFLQMLPSLTFSLSHSHSQILSLEIEEPQFTNMHV